MNADNVTHSSVLAETIERPSFEVKYHKDTDITEFTIKAGIQLDEAAAHESKLLLEELKPGKQHFLLVSSPGFFRVAKKVRKLGATKEFSLHLAAVACYSTNASLILLGELYNKINKPAVPTKIFYSWEAAEEWLFQQMKSGAHN